ncbi:hypothetical protein [Microbulbifer yueqingensis]|nr:hypothetical protein [Microbulbifer yueqingensis]
MRIIFYPRTGFYPFSETPLQGVPMVRAFATVVLVFFASWASGKPDYQPATIENDLELLAQVPFPEIEEDFDILIRCSGYVRSNKTRFSEHVCFSEAREFTKLSLQIDEWFGKELLVSPAKVDGESVKVLLKYSIRLLKSGGRGRITLFQHHGDPEEGGGDIYLGAQKVFSKFERPRCHTCSYGTPMVATAAIDESGNVRDVHILSPELTDSCKASLAKSLTRQEFIPAVRDGTEVPSRLVATFKRHGSSNALLGSHCHLN